MLMNFPVSRAALCSLASPMFAALLLASCTPATHDTEWARITEHTPAFLFATDARDPSLAADAGGRVALTWVVDDVTGAAAGADVWLAVSRDSGAHFATPVRVNETHGQVASYAESRPVVAFGPAGHVMVAWAARRDSAPDADDIEVRMSEDDGAHFGPALALNSDHGDPHSTYHGFMALAATASGQAAIAWLDGRAATLAPGEDEPARAQVRLALSRDGGATWSRDTLVAGDACSCCRIALQLDDAGRLAIAYRGARDDLRDPRLALSLDHGASFAIDTLVARDRWWLPGCPSIGPSVALAREGGFFAWYTGSDSTADGAPPGVYLATWRPNGSPGRRRAVASDRAGAAADGGADAPGDEARDRADDSAAIHMREHRGVRDATRPMLTAFGDGALLGVLAEPRDDSARHVLAVRRVDARGAQGPWTFLGAGVRGAAMASAGPGPAWVAWVEKLALGPRIRIARIAARD